MTNSSREVREIGIEDLDHAAGGMLSLGVIRAHFCTGIGSIFGGPVIGTAIGSAATGTGDESDARSAKPKP